MRKIIIVGAGGFGREIAWIIDRANQVSPEYELIGFCDDDRGKRADVASIAPFLGYVEDVIKSHVGYGYICAIGDNRVRCDLMRKFNQAGLKAHSVVDPSAVVAADAEVGGGCFIGVHAVVSTGARLGSGCVVNANASVGHDVRLGDFAQVCPGVSVSGGCEIGEGALLGSNSCAIPGRKMGAWSVLGAGGVLIRNLEAGASRIRVR